MLRAKTFRNPQKAPYYYFPILAPIQDFYRFLPLIGIFFYQCLLREEVIRKNEECSWNPQLQFGLFNYLIETLL